MSNIQFYWDDNVGAVEYDVRRTLFTTKPSVPDVSFDTIVYSEDDKVAKKILNDTLSDLTDAEIANEGIVTGKWAPEVVQFNS